ncbi:MAG: CNNM domain-containing protein [Haloferacaceae archaeon]
MLSSTAVAGGIGALVVLLGLSAFFSSSETAIFSLPAEWEGTESDPRAEALADLRGDPHRLLVTLLVGNNVVNIATSSLMTLAVSKFISGGAVVAVATLLATSVVLVFGEIVPKSYGLANAETWSLAVARPLGAVELALSPLVAAFDAVTRRLSAAVGGTTAIERQYEE